MGVSVPKPSLIRDSPAESWSCAMTGGASPPPRALCLSQTGGRLTASCKVQQLWKPSWEDDVPLPFSHQQSAARARVRISSASRLLMSSLAMLVSLTSELSWRLLKFSGACFWAAVYILWFLGEIRDLACVPVSVLQNKACPLGWEILGPGSHFCIHLMTRGISRRFYLRFWMVLLKKNNWIFKKSFFLQTWKSFSHDGKPGERPAHTEVEQLVSRDGALSCGVSQMRLNTMVTFSSTPPWLITLRVKKPVISLHRAKTVVFQAVSEFHRITLERWGFYTFRNFGS